MQDRQDLILYIAQLHANAVVQCQTVGRPRAFCEVPMRLMSLREWVHDYRVVLEKFFEVSKTGFNLGNGTHEISILIPRTINDSIVKEVRESQLEYLPPERPDEGTISKVYVQRQNAEIILARLAEENRADLRSPCEWILAQDEINFMFKRAGKLQQRDTSVWPIPAIETWPSWLRELLFGPGLDIENAYTQYLVQKLHEIEPRQNRLALMYPDLLRSIHDKTRWRRELCENILGLPLNDNNISIVKKICMSLANGSRISPAILTGGGGFSVTADIIIKVSEDISPANLQQIGRRLQKISKQYSHAKKAVCLGTLGLHPSRSNQKHVFGSYFEWERIARYLIWEAVEQHGIMVHDGIDGIPEKYLADIPELIRKVGLKVTT